MLLCEGSFLVLEYSPSPIRRDSSNGRVDLVEEPEGVVGRNGPAVVFSKQSYSLQSERAFIKVHV